MRVTGTLTYSIQRDNRVLEKWLHDHSKVLSAIIAASIHHFFCLHLKARRQHIDVIAAQREDPKSSTHLALAGFVN